MLQAHFSRLVPPITDYITDQKSVLDQAIRILQAMVDVAADGGWLHTTLRCMHLTQMVVQGQWLDQSSFGQLPFFDTPEQHALMARQGYASLQQLLRAPASARRTALGRVYTKRDRLEAAAAVCERLPVVDMQCTLGRGGELQVKLQRVSGRGGAEERGAYAPMFPKHKREGWWLVCGDAEGELLALKRITLSQQHQTVKLELTSDGDDDDDDDDDDGLYGGNKEPRRQSSRGTLWVYLISDSYIGLDIQVPVAEQQQ